MKTVSVTKILIAVLFGIALILTACERLPTSVTNKNNGTKAVQRKNLGNFGFKINEQTGEIQVYHNGRLVTTGKTGLGKNGAGGEDINAVINGEIQNLVISYEALNQDNCGSTFGNPGGNLRSIKVTFVLKNPGSNAHEFIVPANFTATNLLGIAGSLKTDFVAGETFVVSFDPALNTCSTFSFFFDLVDTFS